MNRRDRKAYRKRMREEYYPLYVDQNFAVRESKLTVELLDDIFQSYMRLVPHPHMNDLWDKYPDLLNNEAIYKRLAKRYPSRRMSDEELQEKMYAEMAEISIFGRLLRKYKHTPGGSYRVPFKYGGVS